MTKLRLLSLIRRRAYYQPMLRQLEESGIEEWEILPPTGRGHAILEMMVDGQKRRIPLPGTINGHSEAIDYVPANIRRVVKRLRA